MHALALALWFAGVLAHFEGDPDEVKRLASDVIELSTHHSFAHWLAGGKILSGWARSALGRTAEGIAWIESGIMDWRATGSILIMPFHLTLKAEAFHLANHNSKALEAIGEAEAPKLAFRFAEPSESHGSRSRFRSRNARNQLTQNIASKERVRQVCKSGGPASEFLCGSRSVAILDYFRLEPVG